ncbi:MAG: MBL fold metallo-hydrolase [Flavobacteriaceae bacterium]|jgi:glyoxylase-like metal-dependent hydrolase (beta-lactamase superfamily II)|nr:MBL fold metallo-hydrolase [Flavobacteriaceae bacterium]NVJ72050.1 MBL fold metallo-hydrolase [Flavobacteriaceae bacterium]
MKIYPIESGHFKLDGGAMFGVVPKSIWNRTNPADQNNMIDIAARCLLVETSDRRILIDTGMGNKQSEKFFSYYYQWGNATLEGSLAAFGIDPDSITDVFLTHLHFDHCGGAVSWNKDRTAYEPTFKNARYWTNQKHWDWAIRPNDREKASFLSENLLPLEESGQLHFLDIDDQLVQETPFGFQMVLVDGHTEKQMLPLIEYKGERLLYTADLIPTVGHLPIPYVMGYDVRPLITLKEKKEVLDLAVKNNWLLFFEHDAHHELCSLKNTERGIRSDKIITFNSL